MAKNLGFIDVENNNRLDLAVSLGALKGTYVAKGLLAFLSVDSSSDSVDFYRFELDASAPLNSYIELTSADVVNIDATYKILLYKYDPITHLYQQIKQSYQLDNTPFGYRMDLTSLASGTYVFGVTGAEWNFGNATGLYDLRISIPSPSQPGTVIDGTDNDEQLIGGSEENTINGNGGADTLNGGGGDDTLNGGAGNDILIGGRDNDLLNGGSGVDRVIDSGNLTKFTVTNDRLIGSGVDVLVSIEQVQLTGGDGKNMLDASAFTAGSVNFNGGGDDDTLLGGGQNDRLAGGDGFDYLDGGKGQDVMIGGNGGDTYTVDDSGDIVIETNTLDYDVVNASASFTLGKNLESLVLKGTAAINGTGNALDNLLIGNGANNTLTGAGGHDTLDGGKGVDTLIGGAQDDVYIVDRVGDVIIDPSATDFDLVKSSANKYTLSANLENLLLIDNGIQGIGNALGNQIAGNGLNNILSGGGGSDSLNGNSGDDTMDGGDGQDYLYGGLGNDIINGGSGDDYIDGDVGNDIENGGAGKDSFNDAFGNDTYVFQYGQSASLDPDQIDNFTLGSDKIDLLGMDGGALGRPGSLTRAGIINDFGLSIEALAQIFSDADATRPGNQALGLNSAAIVETNDYYNAYLIINDGTAGFQANSDLVINLALYGSLPPWGAIPVDTIFA